MVYKFIIKKTDKLNRFRSKHWYEIVLVVIMSFLVIINLDWRYIGSDEGYNVTMGQYILKNHGLPKVWDGKNIITTINGNDFNNDLLCINLNYGAYYITAIMQLFFGKNTFLIRLPFALMGIISSIVWYKYFKEITNIVVARIFLLIYCLSIPLIVYIRNANYFAPSLLFIGFMYFFYKKGEKENKKSLWILFVICSFIQFHINYMLFVFTIIPILFDYLLTRSYKLSFFISYVIILISTAPFFIWMRYNFYLLESNYRNIVIMNFSNGYYRFIEQFWHISFYIAPIIPMLIIFFISKLLSRDKQKIDTLDNLTIAKKYIDIMPNLKLVLSLIFTILFNFIFLCFFTFEFETRYYLAVFPFLYFSLALIIDSIYKIDRIMSLVLIVMLLFTNIINRIPYNIAFALHLDMNNEYIRMVISSPIPRNVNADANQSVSTLKYTSYFGDYISSFNKPVIDSLNVVMTYLNDNSVEGDTIATYGTDPWTNSIQYYTDLKLVNNLRPNYGSWANDTNYYNAERYYKLVYCPDELVDWIILPDFKTAEELGGIFNIYSDSSKYEKIVLNKNLDNMANDIWLYSFGPDDENQQIAIYHKKIK